MSHSKGSSFLSLVSLLFAASAAPQSTSLITDEGLQALIRETSGERALRHFADLLDYSGFSPSLGSEQTAAYIAERARTFGLSDVHVESFPSDGERYYWAFRTSPWWEGKTGDLWLLGRDGAPEKLLASFALSRTHLGRFSTSASVEAELVDVGSGMSDSDYEGKDVAGNVVLAFGPPGPVQAVAVWEHGASGVVVYRTQDHIDHPDLVSVPRLNPFRGPNGDPPGFVIALSYRAGRELVDRLARGEALRVRAHVEAETKAGQTQHVHAVVRGSVPELPEVWIQAHTNYRNTGGGNNLTGVGATLDLARTLQTLVDDGRLPRPRRNVHFVWGPEHTAMIYFLHDNPDARERILAFLNLDMVGDHQVLSKSVLRLYRTPYSLPSFLNDVVQEMFEVVAAGNTVTLTRRPLLDFGSSFRLPIVDPGGSQDPFYYYIEPFWGPSDHEDVAEGSLGVHAVLLNTWPDPYIGTQEDTIDRADATQMKRAEVIAGASAYIMASAEGEDLYPLTQNALSKARARLALEERRAMDRLNGATERSFGEDAWLAKLIVEHAYDREAAALATLTRLATDEATTQYVRQQAASLRSESGGAARRLDAHRDLLGKNRGWKLDPAVEEQTRAAGLVPVRTERAPGPINFFRPEYGRDWMIQETGDPDFASKVRLAKRGHYYLYETLSFADGKRSLGDIRTAVAVEYGPAPLDEIEEYFRLLEKVGVVELR